MGMPLLNGLTPKQELIAQKTAQQIIEHGETNQTQVGLEVYDTHSPGSARTMVSRELQKVDVKLRIEELLELNGLSLSQITSNLSLIANKTEVKFTGDQVLKANIEALKILNAYPDKKTIHARVDFKAKIDNLDFKDLKKSLESMRTDNNVLIEDIK